MDVPDFDWKERKKREREERERVEMLVMAAALAGEEGGKEEEGVVAAGSVEAEAPAPVVVAPVVAAPAVAPIVAPIVAPAAEEEEPLIEIVVGVSQIPKDRFRLVGFTLGRPPRLDQALTFPRTKPTEMLHLQKQHASLFLQMGRPPLHPRRLHPMLQGQMHPRRARFLCANFQPVARDVLGALGVLGRGQWRDDCGGDGEGTVLVWDA